MKLTEKGGDNPVKSGAASKSCGGTIREHAVVDAIDLNSASQSRQSAAEKKSQHHVVTDIYTSVSEAEHIQTDSPNAVTDGRPPQEDVNQDCSDHSQTAPACKRVGINRGRS